ncbi:nuclear transport factor 2 family protein [Phaeobacter piscinae]|uniref:nuclear transport factor 2 family protein n=1 Tax=Phaeobacter piscinae TaxID=1580596 RepID=UPI000BBE5383|nr:nuclear transport factor 2 family protein [Phaeobacter piscinae]ATG41739.1 SnoaL-like polyketide cyclase [Phaeobacter piscinae]AUR38162.1 SnoaL-like polyketide cyclase [Phaeobacter piscinae]
MTHTELVLAWLKAIWEDGDLEVIDQLLSHEAVLVGVSSPYLEPGVTHRDVAEALQHLLGPRRISVTHIIEQGLWVSARLVFHLKNPSNGLDFDAPAQIFAKVENERFTEFYSTMDYLELIQNLGLVPDDTFYILLTKHKLTWQ